jgi:putative ATP-dependent endonuclease of OLD family
MHNWRGAEDLKLLSAWLPRLREHRVFFSAPLDLDLVMLAAFRDAYEAVIPAGGGPKMTAEKAAEAVLGTAGPGLALYAGRFASFRDHLPAYR